MYIKRYKESQSSHLWLWRRTWSNCWMLKWERSTAERRWWACRSSRRRGSWERGRASDRRSSRRQASDSSSSRRWRRRRRTRVERQWFRSSWRPERRRWADTIPQPAVACTLHSRPSLQQWCQALRSTSPRLLGETRFNERNYIAVGNWNKIIKPCSRLSTVRGSRSIMHTEKHLKTRVTLTYDLEIQHGSKGCRGTCACKISASSTHRLMNYQQCTRFQTTLDFDRDSSFRRHKVCADIRYGSRVGRRQY